MPELSVVVAGSRPGGPAPGLFEVLLPGLVDGTVEAVVATAAGRYLPIKEPLDMADELVGDPTLITPGSL